MVSKTISETKNGVIGVRAGINTVYGCVPAICTGEPFAGPEPYLRTRHPHGCHGAKNWLFAGSDSGGEHAAVLYSLIGTCRLNNVEPEKWLRYVIEHIQDWPANQGTRSVALES